MFGIPISITADNGRQFVSDEFRQFCAVHNVKLISTTPYWPQQNGEVGRQNRSLLESMKISQNTGKNWVEDLQDYMLIYRSTPHSTTSKAPAEMLFGHNIRDKLPSIRQPLEIDKETADKDKVRKERGKLYSDARRNAKESDIQEGDGVLAKRMIKTNKLASTFEPEKYKVVEKKGSEAVIEATDSGKRYRRNVAHLQKISSNIGASSSSSSDESSNKRPYIYIVNCKL